MAYPSVTGTPVTTGTGWASSDFSPNITSLSRTSGNLLIAVIAKYTSVTLGHTGWTALYSQNNLEAGHTLQIIGKIAAGSDSLTLTRSGSTPLSVIVYEIADWYGDLTDNTGLDFLGAYAYTGGLPENNPNPPSLTAAWGSAENLWMIGWYLNDGTGVTTTFPTGYTAAKVRTYSAGVYGAMETSTQGVTAETEDPGSILNGPSGGISFTLAIRPAAGSTAKPIIQSGAIGLTGVVAVTGEITAQGQFWRVPTNATNGTAVHVTVFSGSSPTYSILAQGTATVSGGFARIAATTGTAGDKAFAVVHNYTDNTATTSIYGGPAIATRYTGL